MSYEMELTPEEEEEYHESLLSQNTIVTMNRSTNNNTDNNVEFEDDQVELGNDTKEQRVVGPAFRFSRTGVLVYRFGLDYELLAIARRILVPNFASWC